MKITLRAPEHHGLRFGLTASDMLSARRVDCFLPWTGSSGKAGAVGSTPTRSIQGAGALAGFDSRTAFAPREAEADLGCSDAPDFGTASSPHGVAFGGAWSPLVRLPHSNGTSNVAGPRSISIHRRVPIARHSQSTGRERASRGIGTACRARPTSRVDVARDRCL